MPMTGAERVRKHRERLRQEREAKIRATWNPSRLAPVDLDRLLDWLTRASVADISAFLAPARDDWLEVPLRRPSPDGPAARRTARASRPAQAAPPRPQIRSAKSNQVYKPWLKVLGLEPWKDLTKDEVVAAYREKMRTAHPDAGGKHAHAVNLSKAKTRAMQFLREVSGESVSLEELTKL